MSRDEIKNGPGFSHYHNEQIAASVKIPRNEMCHLQTFLDVGISLAYGWES
jgi:hypothetical protein